MTTKSLLRIDLETYSPADLRKCGVYPYAEHPDFEILLFGYAFDDEPVQVVDLAQGEEIPEDVVEALFSPEVIKTAYNASFERTCLASHFGRPMPPEQWRCTSVLALTLGMPGNLAAVSEVCNLAPDKQKMGIGYGLIRYFCIPCKPTKKNGERTRNYPHHDRAKWDLFKLYCLKDVEAERAIYDKLIRWAPNENEQRLWALDQKINDTGIMVDLELVKAAIKIDDIVKEKLTKEFFELTGITKATQVAQIKKWLEEEHDIETEQLNKEAVKEILKLTGDDRVERAMQLRQMLSKSSVSKYHAMLRAVCSDGRIRGLYQFYGANRTGRWSSRIVQTQNLARSDLEHDDLVLARQLVKALAIEEIEILFGPVQQLLSELIRTALIAPPGKKLAIVDFSAVEARGLAWGAGEEWRMEVFRTHGKIYEASAAEMFKVPLASIDKKSPLRQKGKISELACGFGGGAGALVAMGALKMGLREEELPELIKKWRESNPAVTQFWKDLERHAKQTLRTKISSGIPGKYRFDYESGFLFMTLPSGRRLAYVKPRLVKEGSFTSLTYDGMDQVTKQWGRVDTFGGKLCVSEGTPVLTQEGWKPIETVAKTDFVWDGIEWVETHGAVFNGVKAIVKAHGVWMTPDHQVLTEKGWKHASQSEGYNRAACRLPDSYPLSQLRREEIAVDSPVRLWKHSSDSRDRAGQAAEAGGNGLMRVHAQGDDRPEEYKAWNGEPPSVFRMAQHDRSLHSSVASSLEKLWGSWHIRMRKMGLWVREFLGRHGGNVPFWADIGSEVQLKGVLARELSMGSSSGSAPEHQKKSGHTDPSRANASLDGGRVDGYWADDASLPREQQLAGGRYVSEARSEAPVYDLINCGALHRFTVADETGRPLIVHNCENWDQAMCRDALGEALLSVDSVGLPIVGHVHDEAIIEVDEATAERDYEVALGIFAQPMSWAPGLPLAGDGFISPFYKK